MVCFKFPGLLSLILISNINVRSQPKDTIYRWGNDSLICDITEDMKSEPSAVFAKVEEPPVYPGGNKAWDAFVKKNFQAGEGEIFKINVMFIVELDGSLSNFSFPASRMPSPEFQQKFMEQIRKGGKWFPARQNGYCVRAYHILQIPITVFTK